MRMLRELFPGLAETGDQVVPHWSNYEAPWEILVDSENGLVSQIVNRVGSEDGVFIDPTSTIGDFVTIEGPCFIGSNVEVRNSAYIRKGSWICDGAVVGHSTEVKNSILLPGSKAPHFNYIGDSIIGADVNLGAGVKIANLRIDGRNVLIRLEDKTVDSGTNKLGALVGDGSSIGCNSVLNPGTIIPPNSRFPPNSTIPNS